MLIGFDHIRAVQSRHGDLRRIDSVAEMVEGRRPVEGRPSCDALPGRSAG